MDDYIYCCWSQLYLGTSEVVADGKNIHSVQMLKAQSGRIRVRISIEQVHEMQWAAGDM
jgi:hypothetical protein